MRANVAYRSSVSARFQWATVGAPVTSPGSPMQTPAGARQTHADKVIYKLRDLLGVSRLRRHDAAGQPPASSRPARWPGRSTARISSTNVTAIATIPAVSLRTGTRQMPACGFPDARQTASSWRLPKCPTVVVRRGAVHPEFKSRSRRVPTRCLPPSWRRLQSTKVAATSSTARETVAWSVATATLGSITVGAGHPLVLMAGPCVVESEAHAMGLAEALVDITARVRCALHLQGVVRQGEPHVDQVVRGPGITEACGCLVRSKRRFGVPS